MTTNNQEKAAHMPGEWRVERHAEIDNLESIENGCAPRVITIRAPEIDDRDNFFTDWIADCGFTDDDEANAHRIVLCINACTGLSAEQVAGIPGLIKSYDAIHVVAAGGERILAALNSMGGAKGIETKLAAFDAMREALGNLLDNIEDASQHVSLVDGSELSDYKEARAALALADEAGDS